MRDKGLFGQEEEHEETDEAEKVRRELSLRARRQNKCESAGLRTTLSEIVSLSALLKAPRIGLTSGKKWMMMEDCQQFASITASLEIIRAGAVQGRWCPWVGGTNASCLEKNGFPRKGHSEERRRERHLGMFSAISANGRKRE